MDNDNLSRIVCSGAVGVVAAFLAYAPNGETALNHYINRRAIEERVVQFKRGGPQSETMWDYLQGKGDFANAGFHGLGMGVLAYTAGIWADKRAERKRKEVLKKENPELYARLYSNEKK